MGKAPTIDSLTTIRGLAAVWVVFYHYQADIYSLFPVTITLKPLFNLGNLAVPLFFILSGFVLSYNYSRDFQRVEYATCRKFILTRLARIYPLHFATLMAVLLMISAGKLLGLPSNDVGHSTKDFFLNLLLVHTWVPHFQLNWNFPSWSISSEWFAYLWFPLVAFILNRTTKKAWLIALTVGSFGLMQFQFVFGSMLLFRELQVVAGTFLMGCAIFKLIQYGYFDQRIGYYSSILALAIILMVPFFVGGWVLLAALLSLFSIIVYSLAGLGDRCHRLFAAPILVFMGEVSYSLYMTHTIVQRILHRVIPVSVAIDSGLLVRIGVLCLYAILISLVAVASYYLIEKPFRRLLRSLIKRSPGPVRPSEEAAYPVTEIVVPEMIKG